MIVLTCLFLIGALNSVFAQDSTTSTCSITGRVTIDKEAVAGVVVVANVEFSSNSISIERRINGSLSRKATTDGEGIYCITGVRAGQYRVSAATPTFVSANDDDRGRSETLVTLAEGETVEGIDFSLKRGGVITGHVTDSDGQPAVSEPVFLKLADKSGTFQKYYPGLHTSLTDDLGIYRIYGLPPGLYLVSVGGESATPYSSPFLKASNRTRTFYPGVTDEAKAKSVEVSSGDEATDIDIKIGAPSKTYTLSGRVIDADTGKPVPNTSVMYMGTERENRFGPSRDVTITDAKGEFLFSNLLPKTYMISRASSTDQESDLYGERVEVEIKNEDITGIEIKLHHGASMSGTVVIENLEDQSIADRLKETYLLAVVNARDRRSASTGKADIAPDGTFLIKGLSPGLANLRLLNRYGSDELKLMRIEREGIEVRGGIEIKGTEDVSGVRVILGYGRGIIQGQIVIEGAQMPADAGMTVLLNRPGAPPLPDNWCRVDANGRFIAEGLPPGAYEVEVRVYAGPSGVNPFKGLPPVKQIVTVTNEEPTQVRIVLDASAKETDK